MPNKLESDRFSLRNNTMYIRLFATLAFLAFTSFAFSVEPTPSRPWKAVSGHTTEAVALHADRNSVKLQLHSGKTVDLALDKLVQEDRDYLSKHFGFEVPKEGDPVPSNDAPLDTAAVEHPIGKITGPLRASDLSTYFIYIPQSLKNGRKAPLLHYNDSSPVSEVKMRRLIPACERFGWIMVGSVESRNGNDKNAQCAMDNVETVKKTGIIDPERVYFTGNSGGGAMSWWNCSVQKGAGTIPMNAYLPGFKDYNYSSGHHYVVGGASDFNRYASAYAASRFKKDAVYRPYPGGHDAPSTAAQWIYEDALGWLTMRYLMSKQNDSSFKNERLDFEVAMIDLINTLAKDGNPHLAFHLTRNLVEDYKITGSNAMIVSEAHRSLGKTQAHVLFSDGLSAIHEFGVENFSDQGSRGTYKGNGFPDHNRKIDKLLETYTAIPFIGETLNGLKAPTK